MEENKITDSFSALYPHINRDELLADEDFGYFAKGKLDTEELTSVYGKYLDLLDRVRGEEREKVSAEFANRMASVGALSAAEPPEEVFFTREQVKSMSAAEIRKNYEKIKKSQEKWL